MKYLKVWTSFREVIEPLQDAEKGRLFDMMLLYAEEGTDPGNFAGNERFVWPAAKQIIDLTAEKAEKLRQNGLKGGRPVTKDNQKEANESKDNQSKANESHKEKKRNNKEKERNGKEAINIVPLKRFVPPTEDEVALYCIERRNHVNAQKFVDYYSSNGWKVGKNPMKDWKAAVRTWERSEITEKDYQREMEYSDLPY
jgi:hypothetical protein